jgi:hypothetical protein
VLVRIQGNILDRQLSNIQMQYMISKGLCQRLLGHKVLKNGVQRAPNKPDSRRVGYPVCPRQLCKHHPALYHTTFNIPFPRSRRYFSRQEGVSQILQALPPATVRTSIVAAVASNIVAFRPETLQESAQIILNKPQCETTT